VASFVSLDATRSGKGDGPRGKDRTQVERRDPLPHAAERGQFALKRTRMTLRSYSASVFIVISTPPAA
jgi:hypothetical protein